MSLGVSSVRFRVNVRVRVRGLVLGPLGSLAGFRSLWFPPLGLGPSQDPRNMSSQDPRNMSSQGPFPCPTVNALLAISDYVSSQ